LRADWDPSEGIWVSGQAEIDPEFAHLGGADHHITLAVGSDPTTITLRDRDGIDDTEFLRVLKHRIESVLETNLGVRDPTFQRQSDMWIPNS
jgi:hypothetical protein